MRLKHLKIENFAAFPEADLTFAKGLNVFVGENGTGKTLLMRLPYAVMRLLADLCRAGALPAKSVLQHRIAEKIVAVSRPESLGRLVGCHQGRRRCEVALALTRPAVGSDKWGPEERIAFHFATQSKKVGLDAAPPRQSHQRGSARGHPSHGEPQRGSAKGHPSHGEPQRGSARGRPSQATGQRLQLRPIYLPPRELLTIHPGFVELYDSLETEFDETWRDTCQLLGEPNRRRVEDEEVVQLLEEAMGGRLERDPKANRFYLRGAGSGRMEAPLMAEGVRKLGMLAQLAATGALERGGCLFWDEPEANLNPALIRCVARAMLDLCARDMQIFVATHSLFLLREFELLGAESHRKVEQRYFAFAKEADGVAVRQAEEWDDVDPLALLDEELTQSDRYLAMGERQ